MDISDVLSPSQNSQDLMGAAQKTMGQQDFLSLLVTQLQHQDPFEPVDNTEFIAQLAQFSSLEQAENTNKQMTLLTELQKDSFLITSLAQGSSLIGKEVAYYNPEDDEVLSGTVEALENLDSGVVLKIGDHLVPLTNIMEVSLPEV